MCKSQNNNGCGPFNQTLYEYIPGYGFISYQTFPGLSLCRAWEGWEINNEHFMTILQLGTSQCLGNTIVTNPVFKWNQTLQMYTIYQNYTSIGGK